MLPGCAADDFDGLSITEPGTLTILISDSGTRTIIDQGYQVATDDERNVNDLRLYAFPKDKPDEVGVCVNFATADFSLPTSTELGAGKQYTIKGFPEGDFRLYLVGNMAAELAGKYGITENSLKQVMIDHNTRLASNYKQGDKMNLPMVYAPGNTDFVTISKTQGASATLPLQFACVKISYRILFDSNDENLSKEWGTTGFEIFNVSATNLPKETSYLQTAKNYDVSEIAKSFGAPNYAPDWTGDYADIQKNEDASDVIIPKGNEMDIDWGSKHVAYGTLYLPEQYQYSEDEDHAPCLCLDGVMARGRRTGVTTSTVADKTYTIILGEDGSNSLKDFPRGTYYEVIGKLKNPLATRIDATVVMKDWTVHQMAGNLSHPTLWVDKTRANVTSLDKDSIQFASNVAVNFFCESDPMVGRPIITTVGTSTDGYIRFRVNPTIPFEKFGDGTNGTIPEQGEVTVCLAAGHLKKYVTVEYDVSPLFEIEPLTQTLYWDDNSIFRQADFVYTTNLGGIILNNITAISDGVLSIENLPVDDEGTQGVISVKLNKDPGETKTYKFSVRPTANGYSTLAQTLTVIVKPKPDKYRIYFRPINDYYGGDDWKDVDYLDTGDRSYKAVYPNDYTATDGWDEAHIYMYAQYGENIGNYIDEDFVWKVTGDWPGDKSAISKGRWYAWEFGLDTVGKNGDSDLPIEPGETLVMFTKNKGGNEGQRHRCPHDLDPGISLFNFEDKEGYYIYDPLSYPYYKIFDDEPIIKNVRYRIFSKNKVSKIYINYGNKPYSIYKENPSYSSGEYGGSTWYITELYAEAPVGNYSKALMVDFENVSGSTMLFGGANYYNATSQSQCDGIYEDGKWRRGNLPLGDLTTKTIYIYRDASITSSGKLSIYLWNGPTGEETKSFPGFNDWDNLGGGWYAMTIHKDFKNAIISMGSSTTQTADMNIASTSDQYYRYYYDASSKKHFIETTSSRP